MDEKLKIIARRAAQLFIKFGIRNISMDDICRDQCISKKTLYKYVKNKNDLLETIFDLMHEEEGEKHKERVKTAKNAIDQLLEVSKIVSENVKQFNPTLTYELRKYYPQIFQKFIDVKRKNVYEYTKINLKKGIDEGLYRPEVNIEFTARFYVQKLESMHNSDFLESTDFTFEKIFEIMFENHIRGISNQKGIEYLEKQKKSLNFKMEEK